MTQIFFFSNLTTLQNQATEDQRNAKRKWFKVRTFVKNLILGVTVIKHHDAYFSQTALWHFKVAFSISALRLISSKTQLVQMKAYESRPEDSAPHHIVAFRVKVGNIQQYIKGFLKLSQYLNASFSDLWYYFPASNAFNKVMFVKPWLLLVCSDYYKHYRFDK